MGGGCNNINTAVLVPAFLTTAAWGLSVASTGWCSFVKRNVVPGDAVLPNDDEIAQLGFESHGVGFWGWELGNSCFYYPNSVSFDTKYNSARAFTIVCAVMGGFVMFGLWFSVCCPQAYVNKYRCYGLLLIMTCLFQGLTLLIFKSSICQPGFFAGDGLQAADSVDRVLSAGSNCSIAATVLWFVSGVALCAVAKKFTDQGNTGAADEEAPPADTEPKAEDADPEA